MKLLAFAASLSQDSCNKKLIAIAKHQMEKQKITVDVADFAEFSAGLYNADVQNNQGFPKEIMHFKQRLAAADGLAISSPEYNFSVPGTLKNLIDWVSRLKPTPWKNCPIFLMSASPSLVGGNRGLWAARIPLESCGSFVYPDMFSLAAAYTAFNDQGELKDQALLDRLSQTLADFSKFVAAIKK